METDIPLTGELLKKVLVGSFVSGCIGAQGLGGASTVSALLLQIEMLPTISSTTTKYVTMFGGGSRALMYFAYGDLNLPYAGVLGGISSAVTILSMFVLKSLIKKYNRSSFIVFVLAAVLVASAILVPVELTLNTIKQAKQGLTWYAFGSLCG